MIIAEVGSVHDGSFGNAKKLIDVAKESGADFIKFQMHIAKNETLKEAYNPNYFSEEDRYDYFSRMAFNDTQWKSLIKYSKLKKIKFMCSVFSEKAFNILTSYGVKNIKIPSGEVNNIPLLKQINKKKKLNIFLSTGMSNWREINDALKALSNHNIILMQCTSLYPCPENLVGLNIISEMKNRYKNKYDYGFSDHTDGLEAAISSISFGANYIEKHITFSKKMYGSDAKFALEPRDFKIFCNSIKKIKKIISSPVNKNNLKPVLKMKKIFEKNIVAAKNILSGKRIELADLEYKKSKTGIKACHYRKLIGKRVKKNIKKDEILKKIHF